MIRLLQLLIMGHVHKWEVIDTRNLNILDNSEKVIESGRRYILQCKHCGWVRKRGFDLMLRYTLEIVAQVLLFFIIAHLIIVYIYIREFKMWKYYLFEIVEMLNNHHNTVIFYILSFATLFCFQVIILHAWRTKLSITDFIVSCIFIGPLGFILGAFTSLVCLFIGLFITTFIKHLL